jgi:methionine-rich copper-binding protein CopC
MARWLSRLLLLAVVSGLAVAALATPAAAHGQLAMSAPAKDSTVKEPMESLALYFTEAPAPNAYFAVTAPSGVRIDRPWLQGQPKRLDKPIQEYNLIDGSWEPSVYNTGFPAEIPVAYWPERGVYVVRYLSVASDGEEVRGELRFTYKGKTSAPPKGWQAPTNEPDAGLLAALGRGSSTSAPVPETGGSPAAMGPAVPQTGASPAAGPETGTVQNVAQTTQPADSGTGLSVWLVPAVLVVGAGVLVARAARRPAPAGPAAGRLPRGPRAKTPSRAPESREPQRPRSAKRR